MSPDDKTQRHPLLGRGYEAFTPELHSSGVDLYYKCPRKFMFTERFHLRPRGSFRKALAAGTFYHVYMAALVSHEGDSAAATWVLDDACAEERSRYMELSDVTGVLPDGTALDRVLEGLADACSMASAMGQWTWEQAPWPSAEHWTPKGVEMSIRNRPPGAKVAYRGTLDLIMQDSRDGAIWIVDHKTTSYDPSTVAACYMESTQARIYKQFAEALYGDQVVGICHNVIRKPSIRVKKNQTMEDYIEEVHDWYSCRGKHSSRSCGTEPHDVFLRSWFRFREDARLTEFDDEGTSEFATDLSEVETASTCFPGLAAFPRRRHACMDYNSLCPYAALCNTDVNFWTPVLPAFEVAHRDDNEPLDHDLGGV